MKVAVTYENGQVFQHFGRTPQFMVYEIQCGEVLSKNVVDCNGASHSGVGMVLKEIGADVLICGGMGEGARNMIQSMGIRLISGIDCGADEAIDLFVNGRIGSDPDAGVHACHGH